jgi:large conductance mechanosensitive channel
MEEKKGFVAEFKEFISRGSVMDMAVGIIIGGAFTAIITSLVDDIIMPLIGVIIGGVDFSGLSATIGDANIMYGNFIQAIINFLLIALVIFIMIKNINKLHKKEEPAEEEPPAPAEDIVLLQEIRDLLAKNDK